MDKVIFSNKDTKSVSFIPLGGIGDITKNMYLYEYEDQILIVDCGIGFADETMLGVDLMIPDVSYLLTTKKKIAGMVLTHGHEDHIGALPFVLPQLLPRHSSFPIIAAPLAAALANEKLKEFGVSQRVQKVEFDEGEKSLGDFKVSFIRVTHSIPDTAHVFIRTPVGNFYHGSDFKFDDAPFDGKKSDYAKIENAGRQGVLCLMSDCLGAERTGKTPSETGIINSFEREIRACRGKFIVTTYSSHIARINQIVQASQKAGRRVVFIGRSLLKTKEVAVRLGYLQLKNGIEVLLERAKNYPDEKLTFIVAGSQGQENSGMARIVNGEHREVRLEKDDTVVFSADPIPGSEVPVYELVDTIAKRGARVLYSAVSREFHVSGHGAQNELKQIISLVKPRNLLPIGGAFRQMSLYRDLGETVGYKRNNVLLLETGQEVIFSRNGTKLGRTILARNVYVDEVSGEEIESFILRDRQKLSEQGIVIVLAEIDSVSGQIVGKPDVITRGFPKNSSLLKTRLFQGLRAALVKRKGRVTNWAYLRRFIGEVSERLIFREFRSRPLVLPVLLEV